MWYLIVSIPDYESLLLFLLLSTFIDCIPINKLGLCHVVLSVTGLIADPGAASSIPTRSQTFMGNDHEIISIAILRLLLIQVGLLTVSSACKKHFCLGKLDRQECF